MAAKTGRRLAIGDVARDGCPFPPLVDAAQWDCLRRRFALTPREAEVAWLLTRGLNHAAVAGRLRIRLPTVKTLVKRAYLKVRCRDQVGLVLTVIHAAPRTTI